MSATTLRLLLAASEILNGNRALARHLGISETVLARYMAGNHPFPDTLLLRAVDVILEHRVSSEQSMGSAAETPPKAPSAGAS